MRSFCRDASLVAVLFLAGCTQFGASGPKDYSPELVAAEKIYQSGNIEAAKKSFEAILEKDEKVFQASYRLGTIAFKQNRYEDAQNYFLLAVNVEPRFEKAQYNLAVTHLILAQNHFKYFVATASENTDIDKVSKLLVEIDKFAGGTEKTKINEPSSLERISSELKAQVPSEP